jgi:hypothetical protein
LPITRTPATATTSSSKKWDIPLSLLREKALTAGNHRSAPQISVNFRATN